jgi:uncharacterized membrane protein (UPF0127 family)
VRREENVKQRYGTVAGKRLPWLLFALTIQWIGTAFAQTTIPTLELSSGIFCIEAEVAATPDSRDQGLMNRYLLPPSRGMLFIFPESHAHCMWMRDTHIPLSAAFIDDNGIIVNIADMQPDTSDYHCAAKSVRYVLEMYGGWFRRRGIGPGMRISGLGQAPPGL